MTTDEPKKIDTRIGGVLVLSKAQETVTVLIERHAVMTLTPGWQTTYYGPEDVEAQRIKRLTFGGDRL